MFEKIDLGPYIEDICQSFAESLSDCALHVRAESGIEIPIDQAIPVALLVNELITNSAKYGYPNSTCEAWIEVAQTDSKVSVSVRDQGLGLSPDFEATSRKGLGMRLINAFAGQLGGSLEIRRHNPGVEFILVFPKTTSRITG
jgi:two-component sensor histidine kinase